MTKSRPVDISSWNSLSRSERPLPLSGYHPFSPFTHPSPSSEARKGCWKHWLDHRHTSLTSSGVHRALRQQAQLKMVTRAMFPPTQHKHWPARNRNGGTGRRRNQKEEPGRRTWGPSLFFLLILSPFLLLFLFCRCDESLAMMLAGPFRFCFFHLKILAWERRNLALFYLFIFVFVCFFLWVCWRSLCDACRSFISFFLLSGSDGDLTKGAEKPRSFCYFPPLFVEAMKIHLNACMSLIVSLLLRGVFWCLFIGEGELFLEVETRFSLTWSDLGMSRMWKFARSFFQTLILHG